MYLSCSVLALFLLQANGEVATVIDYIIELGDNEVQLLDQLVGFRELPELHRLYQGFLELHGKVMCSIHFHHRVSQCDDIFHVAICELSLGLQESIQFPLRHLPWEAAFIFSTR